MAVAPSAPTAERRCPGTTPSGSTAAMHGSRLSATCTVLPGGVPSGTKRLTAPRVGSVTRSCCPGKTPAGMRIGQQASGAAAKSAGGPIARLVGSAWCDEAHPMRRAKSARVERLSEARAMVREFTRFSSNSYCAGAVDRRCLRPDCFWSAGGWDPGAPVHHFGPAEASYCAQAQRVLFVGDSTARHTFYAYTAVGGQPLVRTMKWRPGTFEPQSRWPMARRKAPVGSNRSSLWEPQTGWDRHGACDVTHRCTRDEPIGAAGGRVGYTATKAGSDEEMGRYRRLLSNGSWDAVVVQCPFWHFVEAGAYDSTLTSAARRAAVRQRTTLPADDGAAALSGFGAACAGYFRVAQQQRPVARLFLLGHFALAAGSRRRLATRPTPGHVCPLCTSQAVSRTSPPLVSVRNRHSPRSRSGTPTRASASSDGSWQRCTPPSASAVSGAAVPTSCPELRG